MEEVRSPQVEEMWGKVSLTDGTARRKPVRHEMASDGVSGAHGPHRGLGLILLIWRVWSLDSCGQVPGTVQNGRWEGGRETR